MRIEKSSNCSGKIKRIGTISQLKENHYHVLNRDLDGDAPKQFIMAYFYERGGKILKTKPKTWTPYIAKTAEKWYPHESIVEYLINRIGQELGLKMNEAKLVIANTQIRFMSQYFLKKNKSMIHGAEICGEYLQDDDFAKEIANDKQSARELFSFEFISEAIKVVFPKHHPSLLNDLVKLIVFDAIVGNNDRHFYNWAIIRSIMKDNEPPYLAPIYDSARGLMWNWSDKDLKKHYENHFKGGNKIKKYIELASPRISIEGNAEINHFQLIAHLWQNHPEYKNTIKELISFNKEKLVLKMYHNEFNPFFIRERNLLINYVITSRFNILRKMINNDA